MIKILKYIVYAALVLWLGYHAYSWFGGKGQGDAAPAINEKLMNGNDFSLSDLKGEYVVISFWGSWCGPCLVENPKLVAMHEDFSSRRFSDADGFKILSIAIEKSAKRTAALIEKFKLSWSYHIIQESRFVMKAPLALKYNVTELPTKFLIGPDGNIIGRMTLDEIRTYLEGKLN